jgi:hypothetical protein
MDVKIWASESTSLWTTIHAIEHRNSCSTGSIIHIEQRTALLSRTQQIHLAICVKQRFTSCISQTCNRDHNRFEDNLHYEHVRKFLSLSNPFLPLSTRKATLNMWSISCGWPQIVSFITYSAVTETCAGADRLSKTNRNTYYVTPSGLRLYQIVDTKGPALFDVLQHAE